MVMYWVIEMNGIQDKENKVSAMGPVLALKAMVSCYVKY